MKKNIIFKKKIYIPFIIVIFSVFLNNISASQELTVAISSLCTFFVLIVLLKKQIVIVIEKYIENFKMWMVKLNLEREKAIYDLESATKKEQEIEKQIDEIAHHAHNNIQYMKKKSNDEIISFKQKIGNIFSLNAHAQKVSSNNEIKNYLVEHVRKKVYEFVDNARFSKKKNIAIDSDIEKLKIFLNKKK